MPLLQYKCPKCKKEFDEIVKDCTQEVLCPDCKIKADRCYSGTMFSSTGKSCGGCTGDCKTCGGCH